jgi:hypothetical protein
MIAWLAVFAFHSNYFGYLRHTGGDSHATFRTSLEEPKRLAVDLVLHSRVSAGVQTIVTGEWWNYWPLAYLASRSPDVSVVWRSDLDTDTAASLLRGRRLWSVEFSGSTAALESERLFQSHGTYQRKSFRDPLGRPILTLLGPAENSSQKY